MLGLRGKGIERRGPAQIIYEDEREELSAQEPEVPDKEGEVEGEHDIPVRDNFDQAAGFLLCPVSSFYKESIKLAIDLLSWCINGCALTSYSC